MFKLNRLIAVLCVALVTATLVTASLAQDNDDGDDTPETLDVNIAWQPFQNGVMLWYRSSNEIWVLVDDGTPYDGAGSVRYFANGFTGSTSSGTGTVDCSLVPIRGFGQIYFDNNLQNTLGCPLANEIGYNGNDAPGSTGIVQLDGPGDTLYEVDRDGNNWITVRFR